MILKVLLILTPLIFKILSLLDYATCIGVRVGPIKICVEDDCLDTAYSMLFTIMIPRRFLRLRKEHFRIVLLHELMHVRYGHFIWPELVTAVVLLPLVTLPTWLLSILMVMLLCILEPTLLELAEIHVRKCIVSMYYRPDLLKQQS